MSDEYDDRSPLRKPVLGVAFAVAVVAVAFWFFSRGRDATLPKIPVAAPASAPASVPAPSAPERIEHPLPVTSDAAVNNEPLPELTASDPDLKRALAGALGERAAAEYLLPEGIVRRLVVTVDNLPRQKVALQQRPVVATPGAFVGEGDELHAVLDRRNFERYSPAIEVLKRTDMHRLAAVYLRFYPLFQKAYQDLGYPSGYFNDRLVQVIDLLLGTPQVAPPIELVRPHVLYEFADPALEKLPAGQKVLIRMGTDHAAVVKRKIMELRAEVTAMAPAR